MERPIKQVHKVLEVRHDFGHAAVPFRRIANKSSVRTQRKMSARAARPKRSFYFAESTQIPDDIKFPIDLCHNLIVDIFLNALTLIVILRIILLNYISEVSKWIF